MGTIDINAQDLTFSVFVLPPIIAIINRKHWSDEVRALVAMAVCMLYSAIITITRQDLDWHQWRNTLLQVFIGAFGAYQIFWKPSNIAPDIEAATSGRNRPAAPEVPLSGDSNGEPPASL